MRFKGKQEMETKRRFIVFFICLLSTGSASGQTGMKLTASDGASKDFFGVSVSISNDVAIVGSFRDDDDGLSHSHATVCLLGS